MNPDVLRRIVAALEAAGIQYMLCGSFASTYYGLPRSTLDTDFVIDATAQQLLALIQHFPPEAYYVDPDTALEALRRRSMFNVIDLATSWKIDLIFAKAREFDRVQLRRRKQITLHGVAVFVSSAEDSVLAKLEWAKLARSQRHIEDAAGVLKLQKDSLDFPYLREWVENLQLHIQWKDACEAAGIPAELL